MKNLLGYVNSFIGIFSSHIKYQLFLTYIFITIFILTSMGGIFYYIFTDTLSRQYYEYISQLNNQILLNLENSLADLEKTPLLLNYDRDLNDMMRTTNESQSTFDYAYISGYKTIDNYFFNLIYSTKEIYGVYIYSLKGANVLARNKDLLNHSSDHVSNEWWFKEALAKNGSRVLIGTHLNPYVDDSTQVISVARALRDNTSDRVLGVIVVDQNITQIGNMIDNIKIGKKGSVIILDEKGALVYSNDNPMYEKLLGYEEFQLDNNKDKAYAIGAGEQRLYISSSTSRNTGWMIITCLPYSDLMTDLKLARNIFALFLPICLLLTFIISILISSNFSSKLVYMKRLMERVEDGNLDVSIKVTGRNEIAMLAKGFNSMVARIKHLIVDEYNERILRKEAELNLLQAQINPHFLYNTLGSIKNVALSEGADTAARMIQSLSSIFRYNLSEMGSIVTIREEIEHIKNYLILQQYRYGDRLKIIYSLEEKALDEKTLVLTLQPVVENAIIHGLEPGETPCLIEIKASYEGEFTKIYVIDNGKGMEESREKELYRILGCNNQFVRRCSNSIGITNVNSRLKYRFGNQFGLKIYSNTGKGVTTEILLPREGSSRIQSGRGDQ